MPIRFFKKDKREDEIVPFISAIMREDREAFDALRVNSLLYRAVQRELCVDQNKI